MVYLFVNNTFIIENIYFNKYCIQSYRFSEPSMSIPKENPVSVLNRGLVLLFMVQKKGEASILTCLNDRWETTLTSKDTNIKSRHCICLIMTSKMDLVRSNEGSLKS